MTISTSLDHPFVVGHSLDILTLRGDLDDAGARPLAYALHSLARPTRRLTVDMSAVTFADTHGLEPIAESVRRCRQLRQPELMLRSVSTAVTRVLDVLGVTVEPFGLHAWDCAGDFGELASGRAVQSAATASLYRAG